VDDQHDQHEQYARDDEAHEPVREEQQQQEARGRVSILRESAAKAQNEMMFCESATIEGSTREIFCTRETTITSTHVSGMRHAACEELLRRSHSAKAVRGVTRGRDDLRDGCAVPKGRFRDAALASVIAHAPEPARSTASAQLQRRGRASPTISSGGAQTSTTSDPRQGPATPCTGLPGRAPLPKDVPAVSTRRRSFACARPLLELVRAKCVQRCTSDESRAGRLVCGENVHLDDS
jgi:hypothetical protein